MLGGRDYEPIFVEAFWRRLKLCFLPAFSYHQIKLVYELKDQWAGRDAIDYLIESSSKYESSFFMPSKKSRTTAKL
jgi:hypothetical protein